MPNRINFLVISFTLSAVCSLMPGLCGQLPAAMAADDGATAPAGSVQSEKEQLENMAETLKRVVKAASELKGEASHQGINPEDELDQMIMNPFPNFYAPGMNTTGKGPLLPPRKKWVDFSMDQLQKLLGLLKDESMELLPSGQAAPAWLTSEMKAQIEVLQDADKELDGAYKDLQSITQAPPYSNDGICKGADRLKEVTSGMNQCRKRIMKLLK